MNGTTLKCAKQSIAIEAHAVENMMRVVELPEFSSAVEMLASCPRIMTCASGTSGIAAKKFAHSLCCIERGATFMPPVRRCMAGLAVCRKGMLW